MSKKKRIAADPHLWPTVVALDPGTTTGWAVLSVHPACVWVAGVPVAGNVKHWAQGEIAHGAGDENGTVGECLELLAAWPDAAIVAEDFILRTANRERVALSPVRITAALSWALEAGAALGAGSGKGRRKRKMFLQQPAMAMTTATDERLKRWGLYVPGSVHARDATRHAVTFLRRAGERSSLAREAWPDFDQNAVAKAGKWA